jgi:hypothetical protein
MDDEANKNPVRVLGGFAAIGDVAEPRRLSIFREKIFAVLHHSAQK